MGWFSDDSDQAQAYDQVGCSSSPFPTIDMTFLLGDQRTTQG